MQRRILKYALGAIGILILAELFYRFFWVEPPKTEVVRGNHPIYHHVPEGFLHSDAIGKVDYRFHPYKIAKAKDVIRIAFIGDSFTYGFTPPNETIPHYLKTMLKARFPKTKFEVLNFGFVSYSPIIEEVVYRRQVRPLKPDWLIQLYDTFDPQDDLLYAKMATFDETGAPIKVSGEEFLKTGWRAFALVRFAEFAFEVVKNDWSYLSLEQSFSSRIRYFDEPERFSWVVDYSFSIIERTAKLVKQDGSRYMLFQYPPPHYLQDLTEFHNFMGQWGVDPVTWQAPDKSPFAEMVMRFCEKKKLACHNFAPIVREMENALGEEGSRLTIYNNKDGHFTGRVNKVFAQFILEKMLAAGFMKGQKDDNQDAMQEEAIEDVAEKSAPNPRKKERP